MSADELQSLIPIATFRDALGVSDRTILNWRTKGINGRKLSVVQIGRGLYVTPQDIDDFRIIRAATNQTSAA